MSRHIEYSDPSEPTRVDSFAGGALPLVRGCEYEPTDADLMPPWQVRSSLAFIKQNHEKWGGEWEYARELERELAACGLLPLCYRRTI